MGQQNAQTILNPEPTNVRYYNQIYLKSYLQDDRT